MLKKWVSALLCAGLLLAALPTYGAGAAPDDISAKGCVLMVAGSGEVLYEKEAHTRLSMASTTKIMTALLALESGGLDREIVVTDEMVRVEGTSIGLLPGDTISLYTLVAGMLLESGNDAANVTAYVVSGGIEPFLELMNAKARALGMENTHFSTVSGLDAKDHYSTAYDMALLACAAIENPAFRAICAQESARVSYGNPPYARTLRNHNRLLESYDGAFGVKTGFTRKSGRCLVSAAERGGVTLVAVTLHAPNDWADHEKLLDYGFSVTRALDGETLCVPPQAVVVGGEAAHVQTAFASQPVLPVTDRTPDVTAEVFMQPFLYAPVDAGDCVGTVRFYAAGQMILETPLLAADDVSAQAAPEAEPAKPSLWTRIRQFFGRE